MSVGGRWAGVIGGGVALLLGTGLVAAPPAAASELRFEAPRAASIQVAPGAKVALSSSHCWNMAGWTAKLEVRKVGATKWTALKRVRPRKGRQGCDSYYRWSTGYSWTPKSAGVYEVRERYSWRKSRYHLGNVSDVRKMYVGINPPTISPAEFAAIGDGMDLNQVRQIIGSDGRVSRSYTAGGTTYETFEWDVDDRDYRIASIEFANGLTTSFRYMT